MLIMHILKDLIHTIQIMLRYEMEKKILTINYTMQTYVKYNLHPKQLSKT